MVGARFSDAHSDGGVGQHDGEDDRTASDDPEGESRTASPADEGVERPYHARKGKKWQQNEEVRGREDKHHHREKQDSYDKPHRAEDDEGQ